jgi:hypothetical protein
MPIKNIVVSVIIIATSAVVLTNSVEYAVIRGEGSICQRFGKREADWKSLGGKWDSKNNYCVINNL